MLKHPITSLLLIFFTLGYLAGCGDKSLDPQVQVCEDLLLEATLNREHANNDPRIIARADSLEDMARALDCANAPEPKNP